MIKIGFGGDERGHSFFNHRIIAKKICSLKGRHGILIFSCLLFVLFEKIDILIEKTNPDILHQIAKSRNPD
jgi:hypothetical protein